MSTIFSQIIAREIPALIVYEDDQVIAFLDNQPVHLGHTLIVPKEEYENVFTLPTELFAHITKIGQQLATVIRDVTEADGINLYMNNGAAAGQEVWHAHLHVVPRYVGDDSYTAPVRATDVSKETQQAVAKRITEKLS